MKVIQEPWDEEWVEYVREFDYEGERGWGFCFDCEADGTIDYDGLADCAKSKLVECINGEVNNRINGEVKSRKVVDCGVTTVRRFYRHRLIIECDCGEEVMCDRFTNPCDGCDRDYDSAGNVLAPRSQWGEETGEHWTEVLADERW